MFKRLDFHTWTTFINRLSIFGTIVVFIQSSRSQFDDIRVIRSKSSEDYFDFCQFCMSQHCDELKAFEKMISPLRG